MWTCNLVGFINWRSAFDCEKELFEISAFVFLWFFGPFSAHGLPCLFPPFAPMSCHCTPVFLYLEFWHLHSTLHFPICASSCQQSFFLLDFHPEFISGILFLNTLAACTANFNLLMRTSVFEKYWVLNILLKQHFILCSVVSYLNRKVLQKCLKNRNCNCKDW